MKHRSCIPRRTVVISGLALLLALNACTNLETLTQPTRDPVQAYVDANRSQTTAVAAVATAQFYGSQLTATAEERAWSATSTIQAAQMAATSTAESIRATDTAAAKTATASREAFDFQRTVAAEANLTEQARATQVAQIAAAQTSAAKTATVEHATATALSRQQHDEEIRAQWAETVTPVSAIAPTLLGIVIAVMALIALAKIFKAALPAIEIWAITRRAPTKGDQEEYLIERGKDGNLKIYLPNRAAGSAMRTTPEGAITVDGISPYGPEWTDNVLSREQAIRMANAMPTAGREFARRMARAALPDEVKGYAVLPDSSHPALQALLPDKTILDAEWREVAQ